MAKISTLADDFTSGTLDTTVRWTNYGSVTIDTGRAACPVLSTYAGSFESKVTYDLTSSEILAKIVMPAQPGNGTKQCNFLVAVDDNNTLEFYQSGGTDLNMSRKLAGVLSETVVTYNATTMAWLRIREASGTAYWDTSPDGVTWTNRRTLVHGLTLTAVFAQFITGYYGSTAETGIMYVDNVNTGAAVAASGTGAISQTHTITSTGNSTETGTLLQRDANLAPTSTPTDGLVFTATNIPTQSITGTNGTFLQDPDTSTEWWYRQNLASGVSGQFRMAVTNSKRQSFSGRVWIPTPTTFTVNRVVLTSRWASGNAFRLAVTTARQLAVTTTVSTFSPMLTSAVSGGLSASLKYRVTLDYLVGVSGGATNTTTGDSTITMNVYLVGSTTPLWTGTNAACNLGTATITHYDIGSLDTAATAIDVRWAKLQWMNDRISSSPLPDMATVAGPTVPSSNFDILVGFIQSNMRGRADDFDYPTTDFYRAGVYQWDPLTNTVIAATEPAPVFEATPYMGPLNRVTRSYVDAGRLSTGRNLLIVNLAEGGTGVTLPDSNGGNETWWPSETATKTDLYARATAELTAVFAAVGTGSVVKGVFANHGSTDGTNNTPKATFKTRLFEVISSIRSFLFAQGMSPVANTLYVMMQMRPSLIAAETRHAIIDDAQQEAAVELPAVRYAFSPVGTEYERADSVHFNAAGVREIGVRLFAAYDGPAAGIAVIAQTNAVTSTGLKVASGISAISQTSTLLGTSNKVAISTGLITQSHTLTATSGRSASQTGLISHTHTVTSTGNKQGIGTGLISVTHTTTSDGVRVLPNSGTSVISPTHTVTSTGIKAASGTSLITLTPGVTSTSIKQAAGSSLISQNHLLTCTSARWQTIASGTSLITLTHTLTSTGNRVGTTIPAWVVGLSMA